MRLSDTDVMVGLWLSVNGCTRRRFWRWLIGLIAFGLVVVLIAGLGGSAVVKAIIYAYGMLVSWVMLCLGVNRLKDVGRSGWWAVLFGVPVVGFVVFCVLGFVESKETD